MKPRTLNRKIFWNVPIWRIAFINIISTMGNDENNITNQPIGDYCRNYCGFFVNTQLTVFLWRTLVKLNFANWFGRYIRKKYLSDTALFRYHVWLNKHSCWNCQSGHSINYTECNATNTQNTTKFAITLITVVKEFKLINRH